MSVRYDVVVVGGGHAGVEAACAAARTGASVALVTPSFDNLGAMSCNPSIGGIGKGHLVREIDAFDGVIARAADQAAIHHRMLNRSKGPAVQGPRVQADRRLFRRAVQGLVTRQSSLHVVTARAERLLVERGTVNGIIADGRRIEAAAVVLATGTFLGGRLFCGWQEQEGGRMGETAAGSIGAQLRDLEPAMGRLKTGTPPRLDGRTIDWARLARQPSDRELWWMSAERLPSPVQVHCAITATNERTHEVVRRAGAASPLYAERIAGRGPRYCPSIEDKVVRFADRPAHQVFLEPEGLDDAVVYPNGISTSLPAGMQEDFVRTIVGLKQARIVQPGYAVEYDHLDPRRLDHTLQHRELRGLFLAGQVDGTTGYEEAAAQGLLAGLNAAALASGRAPLRLDRATSYLGVMIDDLVTAGVSEPYRMLTARAEHRLGLRADNAEQRLAGIAEEVGALSPARALSVHRRAEQRERLRAGGSIPDGDDAAELRAEVAADALYAPYLARQQRENDHLARDGAIRLRPDAFALPGLSREMQERLTTAAPRTLAEAQAIRGITPAALTLLMIHARAE